MQDIQLSRRSLPQASGSGLCRVALWLVTTFSSAATVRGQGTPLPQDELDLQGRASLAIGSGARALGMGGAFLARADDATAASWNPAGLSYLRLPEISLVGVKNDSLALTKRSTGATAQDSQSLASEPDFIAAAIPLSIGRISGTAQISFQRVLSLDSDRTIGRANARIRQAFTGGFDVLALGSGAKVTQSLRVGLTLNHWTNGYRQRRVFESIDPTTHEAENPTTEDLDFAISGWNLNLGALWSPSENINIGAVFKTPLVARVKLNRARQGVVPETGVPLSNSFVSDKVRLELPGAIGFGASWRPRSTLTISADYTRTFWSGGRIRNFFTLPIVGNPNEQDQVFDRLNYPAVDEANQEDTEQYRAGAEYVVVGGSIKIPFRTGFFSDRQYFRGRDGKPPVFYGVTLGTGIIFGPLLLDVAFVRQSADYLDRQGNEIDVRIRRFYVSLIYRHSGGF